MTEERQLQGTYHLFSLRESIRNKVSWRGKVLTVKKGWAVWVHGPLSSQHMWAVWSELKTWKLSSLSVFSLH